MNFIAALAAMIGIIACLGIGSYLKKRGRDAYRQAWARQAAYGQADRVHRYLRAVQARAQSGCPRHVCAEPVPACCPRECIEEPRVVKFPDGSELHTYTDGFEAYYGGDGRLWSLKIGGKELL